MVHGLAGPTWAKILDDFLKQCEVVKKRRPDTIYGYRRYGSAFAAWADAQRIAPSALTRHDVRRYFASQPPKWTLAACRNVPVGMHAEPVAAARVTLGRGVSEGPGDG